MTAGPFGAPVPGWVAPPRPRFQQFDGAYVRLEPLDAVRHADDLFNAYDGHNALWDYLPYGPFDDVTSLARWIDATIAQDEHMFFAIRAVESGRTVGFASFLRIDPNNGSIEVGNLCFSPSLSGTAGATEAMAIMMRHAFDLGYRRYEWKCNALNVPSRRAAIRLGFSFEGVFRQATVVKGRNRDTAWFSIIDLEWPRLSDVFQEWLSPHNFDSFGQQVKRLSDLTKPLVAQADPALEPR